MTIKQWSNEPNLQWTNTSNLEWINELVVIAFVAAVSFVAESKGYFFEALEKANFFIANENTYFLESKTKP